MNCRICANSGDHPTFTAREIMYGLGGHFPYFQCGACGTLQIETIPDDLGSYYANNYYSMRHREESPIRSLLKRQLASHCLAGGNPVGAILLKLHGAPYYADWVKTTQVGFDDAILDVGCGQGHLLMDLHNAGFRRLTGADPFIDSDINDHGVRILRRELEKVEGRFDLIMLHHSLEHVPDPAQTLKEVHRLLNPDRFTVIRLPLADSLAWRTYGVNWVQLDAPRHLHLPTVKSMHILARETGFKVARVVHDSTSFQFWGSELVSRGIATTDSRVGHGGSGIFSRKQLREFAQRANMANEAGEGDSAAFYFQRV
jgi:SAM-dependent methyltransferase